jgi:hypothetical protein
MHRGWVVADSREPEGVPPAPGHGVVIRRFVSSPDGYDLGSSTVSMM